MDARNSALAYAHENRSLFLEGLIDLLTIPSVSTDPNQIAQMVQAAEWLANHMRKLGIHNVQVFPTKGHPVVFGEWMQADKAAPTVLIYGHYDVQPAEPLELWKSGPFEPVQQGDNLFGRGSSDMKGQVIAALSAVDAAMHTGNVPVNLKFIFEGEEEIGSPSLPEFLAAHKELLASSFALNPDAGMISADIPTIVYGLRGLAYFELRVFGPEHDLHSGLFGGVVHNPAQALCELIAGMHDTKGRITLPGYYDKVIPLEIEERDALKQLPMDASYYMRQTGVKEVWGEEGFSPAERIGARPTLEINGMLSGFTGQGSKTIIPAWAMAKISMRLVPNQDPEDVHRQLVRYMEEHAPNTIRWEIDCLNGGPASMTDRNTPGVVALSQAFETVWGKPPVYKREGGSIPVVSEMQETLGIDSVLTGFGLPDDNIHAPNEKLHLPTWYRGIDTLINFLYNLGIH